MIKVLTDKSDLRVKRKCRNGCKSAEFQHQQPPKKTGTHLDFDNFTCS